MLLYVPLVCVFWASIKVFSCFFATAHIHNCTIMQRNLCFGCLYVKAVSDFEPNFGNSFSHFHFHRGTIAHWPFTLQARVQI